MFYVLKSGCPWRLLPHEIPPWETLYCWFRKWTMNGTFERLDAALREIFGPGALGSGFLPSAGIADSQTTETTGVQSRGATTVTRRSELESGTY